MANSLSLAVPGHEDLVFLKFQGFHKGGFLELKTPVLGAPKPLRLLRTESH